MMLKSKRLKVTKATQVKVDELMAAANRNQARLALYPDLVKALRAYQAANRLHNDSEAALYEEAAALLVQAEAIEKEAKG